MLNMVVHVPIYESADRIDVTCARVEPVVEHIVCERRMLEYSREHEVPGAQRVRQKHVHRWKQAVAVQRQHDSGEVYH